MKYRVAAFVGLSALSACVDPAPAPAPEVIGGGMANPASLYCSERGGTEEDLNSKAGVVTMCLLPDGTISEEWALYRENHKG